MSKNKEPVFVELVATHKDCPLLSLKEMYKGRIRSATIRGIVARSSPKHVVTLSVATDDLKDICTTIKDKFEKLELMDVFVLPDNPGESLIYCYASDSLLDILGQVQGGTFWIPEYQLYDHYDAFNSSAEYFHSFIPSREHFLHRLGELRAQVGANDGQLALQYRFHRGIEKGRIPDLTIEEQYIVETALETDYLENYDKKELRNLAEELGEDIDSLAGKAQDLIARVYLMGAAVYFSR